MRRVQFADRAVRDIDRILRRSATQHGADAAARYRSLLDDAITVLRRDPAPPGSRAHSRGRLFPLRAAVKRTPPLKRVRNPVHLIAYVVEGDVVRVRRVLHESMDLPARLRGL